MPSSRIVLWVVLLPAALLSHGGQASAADAQKIPDTLEQRLLACAACHGKQGEGIKKTEYYPRLAGKPAGYLYNQLVSFRESRRAVPIMTYMVAHQSDVYLREIADYYSRLSAPYPPPVGGASQEALARGAALVTSGDTSKAVPACSACHGSALTGLEPAIPGLIGLNRDYIVAQMGAWNSGQRRAEAPDCMSQIASRLNADDIAAVAAYVAAQPVPAKPAAAPAKSLKLPIECGSMLRP
jgi:cytochrome c553